MDALYLAFAQTGFGQFFLAQNLHLIAPELIITLTILCLIVLSLSSKSDDRQQSWGLATLGTVLALYILFSQANLLSAVPLSNPSVLFDMVTIDKFALLTRGGLLIAMLIVLLMSKRYILNHAAKLSAEFYTLLMTAFLGGLFLCGASDLIMLFVSLETLGISSYIMAGYLRYDTLSSEASLKYLTYGAASTAATLLGFSLLYGLAEGQTALSAIPAAMTGDTLFTPMVPLMIVLILAGIGFKLSAAPFHLWTPDVYEGSPTPVTAFLSVVSKLAGFAMAIRLLGLLLPNLPGSIALIATLSVVSMIAGNTVALFQTNIKRLLAYSTIAHAGYLLLGLVVLSGQGLAGLLFYLLTYIFMNLGAFASVLQANRWLGSDEISAYSGLVKKRPVFTLVFTIFLLALAGIPITAGFFAKFFLFQSVTLSGPQTLWLIGTALLASTVSLFYYLKVIRVMVLGEPSPEVEAFNPAPGLKLRTTSLGGALALCTAGTLLLGFFSGPIYQACYDAAQPLAKDKATYQMLQMAR